MLGSMMNKPQAPPPNPYAYQPSPNYGSYAGPPPSSYGYQSAPPAGSQPYFNGSQVNCGQGPYSGQDNRIALTPTQNHLSSWEFPYSTLERPGEGKRVKATICKSFGLSVGAKNICIAARESADREGELGGAQFQMGRGGGGTRGPDWGRPGGGTLCTRLGCCSGRT